MSVRVYKTYENESDMGADVSIIEVPSERGLYHSTCPRCDAYLESGWNNNPFKTIYFCDHCYYKYTFKLIDHEERVDGYI